MARKLNPDQPYGRITPPHNGAYFEQDGVWFDHDGRELRAAPGAQPRKAATSLPQPQSSGAEETAFLESERPLVDLKEPWFSVQSQIQALTGRKPKNKDEARALLEAEGIKFAG